MKIPERDKKLLYLAAIVGIVLVAYLYGFLPLQEKVTSMEDQLSVQRAYRNDLMQKSANRQYYVDETERLNLEFDEQVAAYAAGITQEEDIMFLVQMEKSTGIKINQSGLTGNTLVYAFAENSMPRNVDAADSQGPLKGVASTITISFTASYQQFKELLEYITTYKSRMVISDVTADYDLNEQMVSGSIALTQYAVTGADRIMEETKIPNMTVGKPNIFERR